MCPGGERWDRAHSVQSLRGEWTVLLPRLLPRGRTGRSFPRGCAQQHQADRDLIGSRHFKRIFKRMDRIQRRPCLQLFFQQIS